MKRFASALILSVGLVCTVAGCATTAGTTGPATPTEPAPATSSPTVDVEAQQRADSWVNDAVVPPGAVRSETMPPTTTGWGGERYEWWCSPMELRTAYWTVPDMTVVEAATWMSDNPTADLLVPIPYRELPEAPTDRALVLNYPTMQSLEGIIYTIAEAQNGVAIRSLVGVIPAHATCPTPEPGTSLGGPGMG